MKVSENPTTLYSLEYRRFPLVASPVAMKPADVTAKKEDLCKTLSGDKNTVISYKL